MAVADKKGLKRAKKKETMNVGGGVAKMGKKGRKKY